MLSQNVLSAKRALLPCGASARTGARASVKIRHHARVQSRSLIPCGRFGHVTSAASLDRNESFHDEDEFTRTSRGVIKEEILGESGPNGVDNVIVDPTKLKSLDQGDKDAVSPAADEKQSTLKVSETAVAETYRKEILGVAIPSLGMVLSDPLISLIDTAAVGQVSSLEVGALGPCSSLFFLCFVLTSFTGSAVTNILASAQTNPAMSPQVQELRRDRALRGVSTGMFLGLLLGLGTSLLIFVLGEPLLRLFGATSEMIGPALAYSYIRALGQPAMVAILVCQGCSLGQQDAQTPFKVAIGAGLVNGVLDFLLVPSMGLAGAAIATAVAQIGAAMLYAIFLARLASDPASIGLRWMGLPNERDLKPFVDIGKAVVSRNVLLMATYNLLTCVSSFLGTAAMAAHQCGVAVFWLISMGVEPVSIAAQTLVARDMCRPRLVKSLAFTLLKIGAWAGALLSVITAGVFFWLPWLFSGDPVVQALIRGLVPQVTLAMVLTGPMMVFDGLAVGASDMSHVARLNLVALLGTAVFLAWFIRHGIGMGHGLPTMWWGFAVFFSLRVLQNGAHFWHGRRSNVFSGRGTEPVPFDPAVEL